VRQAGAGRRKSAGRVAPAQEGVTRGVASAAARVRRRLINLSAAQAGVQQRRSTVNVVVCKQQPAGGGVRTEAPELVRSCNCNVGYV